MIIIGLLLVLGVVGLSIAAFWGNEGVFGTSAGVVELLGYRFDATVGEVFLAGATAGALLLLGLFMLFRGAGHRARRSMATRRQLREQQHELTELHRQQESQQEAAAREHAARHAADEQVSRERAARDVARDRKDSPVNR